MDLLKLNVTQLATITGMDRRTVKDRLAELEPVGHFAKSNLYDPRLALPILLGTGSITDSQLSRKLSEEELRHEKAKADKIELEVQRLKGEVVPIEDVSRAVGKEYAYVRAAILTIPSKRAKALAMEDDPSVIQAMLKEDVNDVLAHLQADTQLNLEPETEDESYFPDEEPQQTP